MKGPGYNLKQTMEVIMKKILVKSALLSTIIASLLATQAYATKSDLSSTESLGVTQLKQETDLVLKDTKIKSQAERLAALEELGWEVQDLSNSGPVSPMSVPGDGTITNYFLKSTTYPGTYLVQALWDYTGGTYYWDSTSSSAYDVLAIAITDQNGNAVNAQGTNGGITMTDFNLNPYQNGASLYNYQNSGATYTIYDHYNNGQGSHGNGYFYITKPSGGTSYYMKSQWIHTWSTSSINLNSITIGYPWSVSIGWSNNQSPQSWAASDQDLVVFN